MRLFTKKCTHILLTTNLQTQGLQITALQQRYSPLNSKKPNFRGVKEADFNKNSNFVLTNFPESFGPTIIEPFFFFYLFHEKSAQTDFLKEMWVSISKGLKHMNTVLDIFNAPQRLHTIADMFVLVFLFENCVTYLTTALWPSPYFSFLQINFIFLSIFSTRQKYTK